MDRMRVCGLTGNWDLRNKVVRRRGRAISMRASSVRDMRQAKRSADNWYGMLGLTSCYHASHDQSKKGASRIFTRRFPRAVVNLLVIEIASWFRNVAEVKQRSCTRYLSASAATLVIVASMILPVAPAANSESVKIGVIGAGRHGAAIAALFAKAGHELMISSRHPEELSELAKELGPKTQVGSPRDAALFGDVVLISVPYGALPQIGRDLRRELNGKIVIETGNPYPARDGDMAVEARRKGAAIASAEYLPGTRLVRAFTAIRYQDLASEAHRSGERVAIPIAGDDSEALDVVQQLVRDAGFDPVVVGPLANGRLFDVGTPVFVKLLTAAELRKRLGLVDSKASTTMSE